MSSVRNIWSEFGDILVIITVLVLGVCAGALVQRSCYAPSPRDVQEIEQKLRQRELRLDQLRDDWLDRVGQTEARVSVEDETIDVEEQTFAEAMEALEKVNRRLDENERRIAEEEARDAVDSD